MAIYTTSFDSAASLEKAFEYLCDFSNAEQWDPGVPRARRLFGGDPCLGARFEVDVSLLGTTTTLTYELIRMERPHLIEFEASNTFVHSHDSITLIPTHGGVRVTYVARLTPARWLCLTDPMLQLLFDSIGDRARNGLIRNLNSSSACAQAEPARPPSDCATSRNNAP